MFDMAEAFAEIGLGFSAMCGGPFHAARTLEECAPVYDDGGSIVTPGFPTNRKCSVQIDAAIQRIREAEGYVDTDMTFVVLASTLCGDLGADVRIEVLAGPHRGIWSVELIERDSVAAGWVGRGRRG